MQLSLFLAQLIGLTTVVFAVAAFWRPGFVREVMADLQRSAMTRLLFGFIALVSGLAIVLSHNLWVGDWRLVITLIGWGGIIKGFAAIAQPAALISLGDVFYRTEGRTRIVLALAFLFGVWFTAIGFGYL
jgi:hypothetical protein